MPRSAGGPARSGKDCRTGFPGPVDGGAVSPDGELRAVLAGGPGGDGSRRGDRPGRAAVARYSVVFVSGPAVAARKMAYQSHHFLGAFIWLRSGEPVIREETGIAAD